MNSLYQSVIDAKLNQGFEKKELDHKIKCYCEVDCNEFNGYTGEHELVAMIELTKFLPKPSIYSYVTQGQDNRYFSNFCFYSDKCSECLSKKRNRCDSSKELKSTRKRSRCEPSEELKSSEPKITEITEITETKITKKYKCYCQIGEYELEHSCDKEPIIQIPGKPAHVYYYSKIKTVCGKRIGVDCNYVGAAIYGCHYSPDCKRCMVLKKYNSESMNEYEILVKDSEVEFVLKEFEKKYNFHVGQKFKMLELVPRKIDHCYYCEQNSNKNLNHGRGYADYVGHGYNFRHKPKKLKGTKPLIYEHYEPVYHYDYSSYGDTINLYPLRYYSDECAECLKTKILCGGNDITGSHMPFYSIFDFLR